MSTLTSSRMLNATSTHRRRARATALRQCLEPLEERRLLSVSLPVHHEVHHALSTSPQISISDVTQQEGNAGQTLFYFTVTLSAPHNGRVTVNYATQDGTAMAGSDFVATHGKLTFAAGETSKTITVGVWGDRNLEADESFFVNLSRPNHATIADGQGVGTIVNDDPLISISDAIQNEGSSGTSQVVVTVTLSNPCDIPVTVNFATADGTATAGSDYDAVSGSLTFAPGETSKSILVPVTGDLVGEPDEYFFVNLSDASNGTIADNSGFVTILDSCPRFSIDSAAVTKGASGTSPMTFTVSLSAPDGASHTVDFTTQDGSAIAGADYLANSGTLTFAPGETTKTITVEIIGDTNDGYDQYFYLNLSGASSNAFIIGSQGSGTIYDVYGDPNAYYYDPGYYGYSGDYGYYYY